MPFRCYNTAMLVERNTAPGAENKTFHTHLEVFFMTMKKNFAKTMQSIGELAACIGTL